MEASSMFLMYCFSSFSDQIADTDTPLQNNAKHYAYLAQRGDIPSF